jgi:four helix bundle protein
MKKYSSFRDLRIWEKGYELLIEIYKASGEFPSEEKYALTSQIRRSSNSVIALIAEAHGRYYYADKCRVLYQARGECFETQSHLSVALGLKYIPKRLVEKLDKEYEGLGVGINFYIATIKKDKT